jgi:hypothetical protein
MRVTRRDATRWDASTGGVGSEVDPGRGEKKRRAGGKSDRGDMGETEDV